MWKLSNNETPGSICEHFQIRAKTSGEKKIKVSCSFWHFWYVEKKHISRAKAMELLKISRISKSVVTIWIKFSESCKARIFVMKKLSFQIKVMITKEIRYICHVIFFSKKEVEGYIVKADLGLSQCLGGDLCGISKWLKGCCLISQGALS